MKNIFHNLSIKPVLLLLMLVWMTPAQGFAQSTTLLGALSPDGQAYIYHVEQPDMGTGYHLFRIADGEEQQLTNRPVYPAGNGQEFAFLTSDIYSELEASFNLNNAQAVFLRLRGDRELAFLMSLAYPQIAQALGRLHIDTEPVTGRRVTYRFVWVDVDGEPTGQVTEGTLSLQPHTIPAPTNLEAARSGQAMRLSWNYPQMTREMEDRVIRFSVQMKSALQESYQPVGESILRQSGTNRFEAIIPVDAGLSSADFVVEAIDVTGKGRTASVETTVVLSDVTAPSPVIEVYSLLSDDGQVTLSWAVSPEPFVRGYHIDRFDSEIGSQTRLTASLIGLPENTFTDTTTAEGKSYQYYITAVSEAGIESSRGNPAIVRIPAVTPPPAPFGLTATWQDGDRVTLSWQTPAQPDRFRTFLVLRRAVARGTARAYAQVNSDVLTGTSITDSGITESGFIEGMYYEYAVAAVDNNGLQSDTAFTVLQIPDLTPPEPPASVTAEVAQGSRVQLSWSASASGDVVGYSVYRTDLPPGPETVTGSGNGIASRLVAELPRNRLFWIDTDVETGGSYEYTVSAVDSAGNEGKPVEPAPAHVRSVTPPPAVRNIQAGVADGGVTVRWEAVPADNVSRYLIVRSELANGRYADAGEVSAETTEWIDDSGRAGHWYQVYAEDADGNRSRAGRPAQAVIRN
ncbi:MAG: fibronectin type III domain-containing protein [Cyclonatronaceae bacterium]